MRDSLHATGGKASSKGLKTYLFFYDRGRKSPAGAGPFSLLIFDVTVCLIVISVAVFLGVKGKLADFVIHGAVMVKDIGLEVIRKGFAGFCPAWRVSFIFCPVIVVQLGFFVFFQLVRVIIPHKALRGLMAGYLAPEVCHGAVSG